MIIFKSALYKAIEFNPDEHLGNSQYSGTPF